MDGSRFDRLARLTADSQSRRGVVRLAFAGALGAGGLLAHDAAGKKRKCKKKKGKKRCDGVCVRIVDDPNNCGDCGVQCDGDQDCVDGVCVGGGGGGLPLETPCDPATDVCEAGLQCDSPTTRHTCSSTVEGIDNWCCLPPGASCDTECDCCGNNYCNNGQCKCNPEDGGCGGGTCDTDNDCGGNTPDCCDGTCVDTLGDPDNCGGCGNVCDDGQTCEAGLCSGGGGGDQCSGPTGICNADPTPCGTSATGETCGCERSVEETNFCADGANPCPVVKECTSTDGGEPTSCEQMLGFHFHCQQAKTNAQGQFCGCGFGTQTGQVCVAECDNINPAGAAKHRQKRRHGRTNAKAHAK